MLVGSCAQFAAWVDAVVFVFSLEDEISFQTVYNYFLRLSSYRNTAEVPMVLVGTQGEFRAACYSVYLLSPPLSYKLKPLFSPLCQDAISATNPRVIDDARARKLSNDLKRSTYYETCSTYGLNVERVFQDGETHNTSVQKKAMTPVTLTEGILFIELTI